MLCCQSSWLYLVIILLPGLIFLRHFSAFSPRLINCLCAEHLTRKELSWSSKGINHLNGRNSERKEDRVATVDLYLFFKWKKTVKIKLRIFASAVFLGWLPGANICSAPRLLPCYGHLPRNKSHLATFKKPLHSLRSTSAAPMNLSPILWSARKIIQSGPVRCSLIALLTRSMVTADSSIPGGTVSAFHSQ